MTRLRSGMRRFGLSSTRSWSSITRPSTPARSWPTTKRTFDSALLRLSADRDTSSEDLARQCKTHGSPVRSALDSRSHVCQPRVCLAYVRVLQYRWIRHRLASVSYTHLRAHETDS